MTMTTATETMTDTETTATEDERMMAIVKACQDAMLEGDDADSVEGLPGPDAEECWGDALADEESRDVLICWQEPHGYHFRDRYDALLHDAESADIDEPVVEGSARPIYARVEASSYVPEGFGPCLDRGGLFFGGGGLGGGHGNSDAAIIMTFTDSVYYFHRAIVNP